MVSTLIKEKPNLRFKEHNEEWKKEKLGKLVEISTGKKDTQNKVEDGLYPFFVRSQTIERINSFSFDGEAILTAGDGVGVGKVFHYINGKFDYHQRVYKLSSFSPSIHSWYLFEYFRLNFIREVTKYTAKTSVDSVRMEMLTEMVIKFPSIEEQTKIATFLSAIDEKIERQQRLLALWQAYKKGIMQQIFSQKLRFKAPNGEDFPKWSTTTLGKIAKFSKGKGISKDDITQTGIPCIRYGQLYTIYKEVIDKVISKTSNTKDLVLSEANDIIIPTSGETAIDIAKACCITISGVAIGGDLTILKTNQNGVFLSFYINNVKKKDISSMAQGISVIHLYSKQLQTLCLELPCIEEQTKIASFLSSLDGKIAHIQRQLTSFREFKKGLLQQMFV